MDGLWAVVGPDRWDGIFQTNQTMEMNFWVDRQGQFTLYFIIYNISNSELVWGIVVQVLMVL